MSCLALPHKLCFIYFTSVIYCFLVYFVLTYCLISDSSLPALISVTYYWLLSPVPHCLSPIVYLVCVFPWLVASLSLFLVSSVLSLSLVFLPARYWICLFSLNCLPAYQTCFRIVKTFLFMALLFLSPLTCVPQSLHKVLFTMNIHHRFQHSSPFYTKNVQ